MFDIISFIPRAVVQGIPLLLGSTGETLTEKSGNLNLGIPGIMYVGAISGVIGSFVYETSLHRGHEAEYFVVEISAVEGEVEPPFLILPAVEEFEVDTGVEHAAVVDPGG